MKTSFKRTALSLAALLTTSAFAVPPSASPYAKASLQSYVQDAASDGLDTANMVICIMNSMSPADMLTQKGSANTKGEKEVQYIALVDMNKCNKSKQGSSSGSASGSSGAESSPNWITATVNVTRASNTSPMLGKIWMKVNDDDGAKSVYVATTATTSPSEAPPYGKVRIDYAGYADSNQSLQFNGFVETDGGNLTHVETGTNSSNTKLALTATSTTAGSGLMQTFDHSNGGNTQLDLKFAYNADYFARSNGGGGDICFNRDKALADKSVWQYGTYDASGEIVDQAHPSFPLKGTYQGNSSWGYASYWGINFGNVTQSDMAAMPDGEITSITSITDQRPGHTDSYRLYKNSGRLVKYTSNQATLQDLDGVQLNFNGDGCKLINGNRAGTVQAIATPTNSTKTNNSNCQSQNSSDYSNWVIQWNKTLNDNAGNPNGNFQVIGVQTCGNNGCTTSTFGSPIDVHQGFKNQPISVWSNSLGQVNIPLAPGNTMSNPNNPNLHQNSDPIYYFTQSALLPTSTAISLECLSNCPTASAIASLTNNPSGSPFKTGTNTQWGAGTVRQTYSFGASGFIDDTQTLVSGSNLPTSGMWQNGLTTGRLYETGTQSSSLVTGNSCYQNTNGVTNAYCEPSNPTTYYQYQTGPQMWNNSYWLTNAGTVVQFDAPINISYAVPATSAGKQASAYDGKTVQMQFNGFGNIGIPGQCVNVSDNTPTNDCSGSGKRWVPAFALDDGTQLTIGTKTVLVKALNAELRLKKESCPAGLSTSSVNLTLPTSLPIDPHTSSSANYIGTQPTVTSSPAVIHGVIQ
jgi:hypothetical protein